MDRRVRPARRLGHGPAGVRSGVSARRAQGSSSDAPGRADAVARARTGCRTNACDFFVRAHPEPTPNRREPGASGMNGRGRAGAGPHEAWANRMFGISPPHHGEEVEQAWPGPEPRPHPWRGGAVEPRTDRDAVTAESSTSASPGAAARRPPRRTRRSPAGRSSGAARSRPPARCRRRSRWRRRRAPTGRVRAGPGSPRTPSRRSRRRPR